MTNKALSGLKIKFFIIFDLYYLYINPIKIWIKNPGVNYQSSIL